MPFGPGNPFTTKIPEKVEIDPHTDALTKNLVAQVAERYGGVETSEEYCIRPGLFFGIVFLFRMENAEPLAIIQDVLQGAGTNVIRIEGVKELKGYTHTVQPPYWVLLPHDDCTKNLLAQLSRTFLDSHSNEIANCCCGLSRVSSLVSCHLGNAQYLRTGIVSAH